MSDPSPLCEAPPLSVAPLLVSSCIGVDVQHMTGLVEKQGHVWLQVLAVLSRSWQNRTHLVARRYSSKILSCMHLSMMAGQVRFQEHGWTVLTNTLSLPPPPGNKVHTYCMLYRDFNIVVCVHVCVCIHLCVRVCVACAI